MVTEASSNQIVCGKTMEGSDAVLGQMLIGNSYSTTPEQRVRFVLYEINGDTRVTAYQWMETQMAYGQIQKQELNSNNQRNGLQRFIFSIGGE